MKNILTMFLGVPVSLFIGNKALALLWIMNIIIYVSLGIILQKILSDDSYKAVWLCPVQRMILFGITVLTIILQCVMPIPVILGTLVVVQAVGLNAFQLYRDKHHLKPHTR